MIKIDRIFDKSADTYDKREEKRFEIIHIRNMEKTKKQLNSNDIVLDFGCAIGTKALELANIVNKIDAIDLSSRMIEIAQKRAVEREIKKI